MSMRGAQAFLTYLSDPEIAKHFAQGTRAHIARLRGSFSGNTRPEQYLEDWRAVYLQTPTTGSILSHLWTDSASRRGQQILFVVRPILSADAPDFPPFEYWRVMDGSIQPSTLARDATLNSTSGDLVTLQEPLGLLPTSLSPEVSRAATEFFQKELYTFFYSPRLELSSFAIDTIQPTHALIEREGIKLFLFVPIYIAYDAARPSMPSRVDSRRDWSGMLQVRLRIRSLNRSEVSYSLDQSRLAEATPLLRRIGKTAQSLSCALWLAYAQESYDREFDSIDELRDVEERCMSAVFSDLNLLPSETIERLRRPFHSEASRVSLRVALGQRDQRDSLAHQTTRIVDSIVAAYERKEAQILDAIGPVALAIVYLLRDTIHSYRPKEARGRLGPFSYPWSEDESPLAAYRDIGLALGLIRAEDAPQNETRVRELGFIARLQDNQVGQPGFKLYQDEYFTELPRRLSREIKILMKHSSFAVLIIHTLWQAVYHTIRAHCQHGSNARVSLSVTRDSPSDGIFECRVENPFVNGDIHFVAKDAEELSQQAARLSHSEGGVTEYSVQGPHRDHERKKWSTTITIRRLGPKGK